MPLVEDERTSNQVQETLNKVMMGTHKNMWCVVRFVSISIGKPSNFCLRATGGWEEFILPAFYSEQEAKLAASHAIGKNIRDCALPMNLIEWTVELSSAYDGSKSELYRGMDYSAALAALGTGYIVCAQHNTPRYTPMKATLDGSVPARLALLLE